MIKTIKKIPFVKFIVSIIRKILLAYHGYWHDHHEAAAQYYENHSFTHIDIEEEKYHYRQASRHLKHYVDIETWWDWEFVKPKY